MRLLDPAFAEVGFTRWKPPHPIGGHVYERADAASWTGLFVFTWSNFRYNPLSTLILRRIVGSRRPEISRPGQQLATAGQLEVEFTADTWLAARSKLHDLAFDLTPS
ncbi:hypothetical protein [Microbacterium testaceum]|uniref:hypothetical protein n=1 Tax=Microbacterium testaceum TaxID=2033 RepID=UPI002AC56AF1|nr:hypothetical protein [Microbacterium testaceum]MDZ5146331.1 hypothetical protein [Microbacterium testaceum]